MPGTRSSCNVPFELSMSGLPYLEVRKIPIGLTVPRFAPGYPIDMTSGECSFLTRHRTVVTNDHMDSTATNRPGSPRLRIQHFYVLRPQPLVEGFHQRIIEVDAPVVAELHLDARSPVPIAHRDRARAVAVGLEQRLERRRGGRAGGGDLAVHGQPPSSPTERRTLRTLASTTMTASSLTVSRYWSNTSLYTVTSWVAVPSDRLMITMRPAWVFWKRTDSTTPAISWVRVPPSLSAEATRLFSLVRTKRPISAR